MRCIALLGTGAMGARVAQKFLDADYAVTVYNRTPAKAMPLVERGASYRPTPRAAVEAADIAIAMVTDDAASRALWLDPQTGAAAGLRRDAIAIESSTLSVTWTQELAAELARQGTAFLDAPVVGSRPQADAGALIYVVGGNPEALAQVREPLLRAGRAICHIGPTGQGMAMKLAVNALFGIQVAALAEILEFLARQGISYPTAMSSLAELPVTSPAMQGAGALMVAGNRAPLFPTHLVEKDFRYTLQAAQLARATMPMSAAARSLYQQAAAAGYGCDNITAVVELLGL